jgi:GTP-binding protein HflX
VTGAGLELLTEALTERFHGTQVHGWLQLSPEAGSTRSSLYSIGQVMSEQVDEQGNWWLEVCMAQRNIDKLIRDSGGACDFHTANAANNVASAAQAS